MVVNSLTLKRSIRPDLGVCFVLVGFAAFWRTWPVIAICGLVLLLGLISRIRRYEIDQNGIRIVRLFSQRYIPFSALGRFEWASYDSQGKPIRGLMFQPFSTAARYSTLRSPPGSWTSYARAELHDTRAHPRAGIFPRRYLKIPPSYRIAGSHHIESAEELVPLLEQLRTQGAATIEG